MGRPSRRIAAIDLANVLERYGFTAKQADSVEPYVWAMAAELAGQAITPDDETRQRVIKLLRAHEADPDPFASFAGADR